MMSFLDALMGKKPKPAAKANQQAVEHKPNAKPASSQKPARHKPGAALSTTKKIAEQVKDRYDAPQQSSHEQLYEEAYRLYYSAHTKAQEKKDEDFYGALVSIYEEAFNKFSSARKAGNKQAGIAIKLMKENIFMEARRLYQQKPDTELTLEGNINFAVTNHLDAIKLLLFIESVGHKSALNEIRQVNANLILIFKQFEDLYKILQQDSQKLLVLQKNIISISRCLDQMLRWYVSDDGLQQHVIKDQVLVVLEQMNILQDILAKIDPSYQETLELFENLKKGLELTLKADQAETMVEYDKSQKALIAQHGMFNKKFGISNTMSFYKIQREQAQIAAQTLR